MFASVFYIIINKIPISIESHTSLHRWTNRGKITCLYKHFKIFRRMFLVFGCSKIVHLFLFSY